MTENHGSNGQNGHSRSPSVSDAIERLADELDEIHQHQDGIVVEYVRGDVVFAVRQGESVSFRLRPDVADAALRTPDTIRSPRGPQWVTLAASVVDEFTLDRALAWFEAAWRMAGESFMSPQGGSPTPPPARPN